MDHEDKNGDNGEAERWGAALWRLVRAVLLTDLAIIAIVDGLGWLTGWRTLSQFGEGLIWGGAAALVLGFLSPLGNWGGTRSFRYQYGSSASVDGISQRARRDLRDMGGSYAFLVRMAAAGLIAIGLGALLQNL